MGIISDGKLVGIVTERDIMKNCCGKVSCVATKVGEIMSAPLTTIDADAPIGVGVEMLVGKSIRRLLVTEKGEIVGIVTRKDLLKGTLEAFNAVRSAYLNY